MSLKPIEAIPTRPNRWQVAAWLAIMVIALVLYLSQVNTFQLGVFGDDATYVILARSLVHSNIYGLINLPGEVGVSKYPFVFPLFLASAEILAPGKLNLFPLISLAASLVNIALLFWEWRWFFPGLSYGWALAVTALTAFSPLSVDQSRQVMAEPLFTTFCLTTILLGEYCLRRTPGRSWSTWMALSLVLMAYTRSIGLIMAGFVVIYLLLRKGLPFWKEWALVAVKSAVFVGLIVLITPVRWADLLPLEYLKDENARVLPVSRSDQETFKDAAISFTNGTNTGKIEPQSPGQDGNPFDAFVQKLLSRFRQHLGSDLRDLVIPVGGGEREAELFKRFNVPFMADAIGYLVSGLVLFGIVRAGHRHRFPLFIVFFIFYFPLLFLWNWIGPRLLYPVQMQLYLGFLFGLEGLLLLIPLMRGKARSKMIIAIFGAAAVLAVVYTYRSAKLPDSTLYVGELSQRTAWIAAHSTGRDVLMSEYPETDYIYSGLKTVGYPTVEDTAGLQSYLIENQVTWILVAPQITWDLNRVPQISSRVEDILPLVNRLEDESDIQVVYRSANEDLAVYQVHPNSVGCAPGKEPVYDLICGSRH